ncbi:MAG: serine/threonine-protein kinase, partial [Planctomycetota bacterium]
MTTSRSFPFKPSAEHPGALGLIQQFRVDRLIGEGGMGYVFEAVDTRLRRPVALKLIKPDASANATSHQRFLREARLMASIQHDNMVTIFEVGNEGSFPFLAMELLEGETLESRLANSGTLPPDQVTSITRQICRGLRAAHRVGVVHRDIKPSNLWLQSPDETVKILDFGLARDESSGLTQAGSLLGTPKYLSPEQARGEPIDSRSDLYSLGVTVYRMLSGRLPHDEATTTQQLAAIVARRPTPLTKLCPDLPQELVRLVDQLLEKEPDARPPDVAAVMESLDRVDIESQTVVEVPRPVSLIRRGAQAVSHPRVILLVACTLLPGLITYPILFSRLERKISVASPATTSVTSELEMPLALAEPRETTRDVLVCTSITQMRGSGPRQRNYVNVTYQPTYLRETPIFEFDLSAVPKNQSCVDAAFTLTLKGGATSSGERKFSVYGTRSKDVAGRVTSLTAMKEMIDSGDVQDLGFLEFHNAGYRKNGLADGIRFRSSALIDLIRFAAGSKVQLWLWR